MAVIISVLKWLHKDEMRQGESRKGSGQCARCSAGLTGAAAVAVNAVVTAASPGEVQAAKSSNLALIILGSNINSPVIPEPLSIF